jgi:uncharacterized membrane protein
MRDLLLFLHLGAAIVWIGGIGFMLFALRPAALLMLEPQPRARLMAEVWRRFFAIVWGAIVVLLLSGLHLYAAAAAALPGWHVMLVLGLLMMAIFGHIHFAGLRRFGRALAAQQWPAVAQAGGLILKLVWLNFALGWIAIAAVKLLR